MPLGPKRNVRDAEQSLVGFVVGDVTYALEIASVREIVAPLPITALPHTPPPVPGVADHRGEVVPVVDLRTRFGLAPRSWQDRRSKWILVDVGGRTVGLVVDSVTEVFGASVGAMRPAPELGGGEDARGLTGVTSRDGQLVFVLDVSRFQTLTEPMARAGMLHRIEDEEP